MQVQIAGKRLELGEALKTRITEELTKGVKKYFDRQSEAFVTMSREGHGFECDCAIHLQSGIHLQAQGQGGDAHAAFDDALAKIEKRVRRYKRRLKMHHSSERSPLPAEPASAYVLAADRQAEMDEDDDPAIDTAIAGPAIIAETQSQIRTMTVSMAVLQLELSDAPALMFRNAGNGGLNMVYRRADGQFGWVDPRLTNSDAPAIKPTKTPRQKSTNGTA